MEKEKLKWEKDFTHNWNILKTINTQLSNLSLNTTGNNINNLEKIYFLNSHIDNEPIDNSYFRTDEKTQKSKQLNLSQLSFNFNYFRNLILVIDLSESAIRNDFKPTRQRYLFEKLENFIKSYFKYNLISTMTIIAMKNYLATMISPLSSDPTQIIQNIRSFDKEPSGFPSLFNALNVT
jgi:transcription initiation factor TFIIH subunit 2